MLTGQLALAIAAIFSGAALYVSLVEQPARLHLDDRSLLTEWKPSYLRGAAMQAPLALIGFLFGAAAWWQAGNVLWLVGALVLLANWPYTLLVILPTNRKLMSTDPASAGSLSRALIEHWAKLHAGRTLLGLSATVFFLWASLR